MRHIGSIPTDIRNKAKMSSVPDVTQHFSEGQCEKNSQERKRKGTNLVIYREHNDLHLKNNKTKQNKTKQKPQLSK